jgi:hypothetical protein
MNASSERIEHRLRVKRRATNYLEQVRGGPLLLESLVALAGEPRDLRFVADSGGTARALWLNGAP